MNEFWNFLKKLFRELFSNKTTKSLDQPLTLSVPEILKTELSEKLEEELRFQGLNLATKFGSMFFKLSPQQREYMKHVAILKSTRVEEMSMDEVIALGDIISKTAELGLDVHETVSDFWEAFSDTVREITSMTVGVATKVVAKTLAGYLP